MNESFLYFIWQFQYFDKRDLRTGGGEKVEVFNAGMLNTNAGPDFSNAKVRIDNMEWAGHVEIHTKSSDWFEHRHHQDQAYENVILHVVWQDDVPVHRKDKTALPTLELCKRVDESLVKEYKKLIRNPFSIPCKRSFPRVDELIRHSMVDRALTGRLETKAGQVMEMLKLNNMDWQETTFQLLARNFGFKVNQEAFFRLGKSLSYKILLKHADHPVQVEALLFGQAGFLAIPVGDDYYRVLKREHKTLCQKYNLAGKQLVKAHWRFLRLRPANFPTVRLAQFAALIGQQKNIFSRILEAENYTSLQGLFSVRQSEYWQHHYQFNRKSRQSIAELGKASVDNILINSVVPLLVAYGKFNDLQLLTDRAVQILQRIPAERNAIITTWEETGYTATSSFDSQALIELYNNFCQKRKCLTCAIGASLLKPKS